MATVLLIGTLDTKGDELAFVAERLRAAGVDVLVADAGTAGPPHGLVPDIGAARAGRRGRRRPRALTTAARPVGTMAAAAAALARRLHAEGRIDGVLGAGGSGNTAIATAAMRALPVGVPKLMVSTMAAGDTRRLHRRSRHRADGVGHRRRGAQLDLRADPRQRRRRDGRHGGGRRRRTSATRSR